MRFRNCLKQAVSPYLRAHARDPIAWQRWGSRAFSLAEKLQRPLFVSVGFSACHWCQKMARECFSHPELAELLNSAFVPVLVDRQELPELDRHLMDMAGVAHELAGGKGSLGWPLHLILTPRSSPVFAFTTLPLTPQNGQIGLIDLLTRLGQSWQQGGREEMERVGNEVSDAVWRSLQDRESGHAVPTKLEMEQHLDAVLRGCDPQRGGRVGAPKFPLPQLLQYLLYAGELHADARPWMQLRTTLWQIVHGGLHDHFGGGFFRYCTDEGWRWPHFERMLSDNALLLKLMAQSLAVVEEPWLKRAVESTAQFLLEHLRLKSGLMGAALGAECATVAGGSMVWTAEQIEQVIRDPQQARLFCAYYGIGPRAGAADPPGAKRAHPSDVPRVETSLDLFCRQRGLDPLDVAPLFAQLREKIRKSRAQRPAPERDETEILAWNSAAISGLVAAGRGLQRTDWLAAAEKAARTLRHQFWQEEDLLHGRVGEAWYGPATLEDAAYYLHALLDLYQATGKEPYLLDAGHCVAWACDQLRNRDLEWQLTSVCERLTPLRRPDPFDQAHPSGYGLWAEGLLRLYQIEGSPEWRTLAGGILQDCAPWLVKVPMGTLGVANAIQRWHAQDLPIWVVHTRSLEEWQSWSYHAFAGGTPLRPIWPVVHGKGGVLPEQPLEQARIDRCGTRGCLESREGVQAVEQLLQQCMQAQRS